ncbi:MAG: YafY family transcriptional regulator [Treponema sp.]|nr:MAG: YafY family transcriptional regulator [Treponema sp.]
MKAERLLAILNILLTGKRVSSTELAKKLEVSVRTVYRDVEALSEAGFPVYATMGRDGGFGLIEGFRMTGQMFSTGELQRIISALDGLSGICPETEIENLRRKFTILLSESGAKGIPCPANRIFIELTPSTREKRITDLIDQAIARSTVLRISYCDVEGCETERDIEPLALLFYWQSWFVYAWCRLRKDFRSFRVTRIVHTEATKATRECPPVDLNERPWSRQWEEETIEEVCFTADKGARGRIAEYFDTDAVSENPDGSVTVCADFPTGDWVVSWIMGLPGTVSILKPEHLRVRIRETAERLAKQNV